MLTPFMVGWILAENMPFEQICELHLDEVGGDKYFPEIALGIVCCLSRDEADLLPHRDPG